MFIPGIPYFKLAMIAAVLAIVAAGYFYVTGLQDDVRTLTENNRILKDSFDKQQAVIEQQQKDFTAIRSALKDVEATVESNRESVAKLDGKFNKTNAAGKKRDVGKLAVQKTKRIERIFNRGTQKAFDCMTKAMGGEKHDC